MEHVDFDPNFSLISSLSVCFLFSSVSPSRMSTLAHKSRAPATNLDSDNRPILYVY